MTKVYLEEVNLHFFMSLPRFACILFLGEMPSYSMKSRSQACGFSTPKPRPGAPPFFTGLQVEAQPAASYSAQYSGVDFAHRDR